MGQETASLQKRDHIGVLLICSHQQLGIEKFQTEQIDQPGGDAHTAVILAGDLGEQLHASVHTQTVIQVGHQNFVPCEIAVPGQFSLFQSPIDHLTEGDLP